MIGTATAPAPAPIAAPGGPPINQPATPSTAAPVTAFPSRQSRRKEPWPNERQSLHRRGAQISINWVRLTFPSPALAPLTGDLAVVHVQPEHASATARTSTSDLIRVSPEGKYRLRFLTVGESQWRGAPLMERLRGPVEAITGAAVSGGGYAVRKCAGFKPSS